MGKASKRKGSEFERKIAKDIIHAAGGRFGSKDCYRTPQSGGHKFAGESDLIISKRLQKLFCFCVECKHWKSFKIPQLFCPTVNIKSWLDQVLDAAQRDPFRRQPLVVCRGNGTDILAGSPLTGWSAAGYPVMKRNGFIIWHEGVPWKFILWSDLMKKLGKVARTTK